jgi:hypothetical protein
MASNSLNTWIIRSIRPSPQIHPPLVATECFNNLRRPTPVGLGAINHMPPTNIAVCCFERHISIRGLVVDGL